jgi:hypothetical protein
MKPEPQTHSMDKLAHRNLWSGVLSSNFRHEPRALAWRDNVGHAVFLLYILGRLGISACEPRQKVAA